MQTQHATLFGAGPSRWRRAGLALAVGLAFAFGLAAGPRGALAAGGGGQDCVPAESPMGSARDALKGLVVGSETFDENKIYLATSHNGYRLRQLYLGLDGRAVRHADGVEELEVLVLDVLRLVMGNAVRGEQPVQVARA